MFRTDEFAYFAYGSNMSVRRLVARVPSARVVATGFVSGCRLVFDKASKDGSGKCDCESTGVAGDRVYGVIFGVVLHERVVLDRFEGTGAGYEPKTVKVDTIGGALDALTYVATNKRFGLMPYHWYKQHVLIGAREADLPADYIRAIEAVASADDPEYVRAEKEASMYV
jgi:gamma-glutamylcyclotransferase